MQRTPIIAFSAARYASLRSPPAYAGISESSTQVQGQRRAGGESPICESKSRRVDMGVGCVVLDELEDGTNLKRPLRNMTFRWGTRSEFPDGSSSRCNTGRILGASRKVDSFETDLAAATEKRKV